MSNEEFKKFVSFLIDDKHVQDPDVLLFKGVFDNDREVVSRAIKNGANVNVTDTQIINRYSHLQDEHAESKKKTSNLKDKLFEKFVYYLVDVKHVQDPDVILFKAVFDSNNHTDDNNQTKEKIEKAINDGANPNVTDTQIIKRHSHFYKEFLGVIARLVS